MTERTAACVCGALTLTVTGEPLNVHACTCTKCQRASGGVMTFSAWYPDAQVRIAGDYSTWRQSAPGEPEVMTAFCPVCGGGGWFRTGRFLPGAMAIPVGTFADSDFPQPNRLYWWANRPHWLGEPEGIEVLDAQ